MAYHSLRDEIDAANLEAARIEMQNQRDRNMWAAMAWAQANPEKLHEMATRTDKPGQVAGDDFMATDFYWAPMAPEPVLPPHMRQPEMSAEYESTPVNGRNRVTAE